MCGFARSTDRFRLGVGELEHILEEAKVLGVGVVRFTGGEPLLHREIVDLVTAVGRAGMACSIITNGYLLPRLARDLAATGLAQVIVSIDGATAETHDRYRDTPQLFDRGIEGLRLMRDLGIHPRVNTVVGAHNYAEMPALQALLRDVGVQTWELSALKLEGDDRYANPADVLRVGAEIYAGSPRPLGKPWYGSDAREQSRYFDEGVPPGPSGPACHVVDDVIYVDGRNGGVFPCSCLPHRDDLPGSAGPPPGQVTTPVQIRPAREAGPPGKGLGRRDTPVLGIPTVRGPHRGPLLDTRFRTLQEEFREHGPQRCTGCSATAAGYSDDVGQFGRVAGWAY